MDYATRYPEAIALKRIGTPTVAEALVDMFSRLDMPEEILSDFGTHFVSECVEEVNRLLSFRHQTTRPYQPACNGPIEPEGYIQETMRRAAMTVAQIHKCIALCIPGGASRVNRILGV